MTPRKPPAAGKKPGRPTSPPTPPADPAPEAAPAPPALEAVLVQDFGQSRELAPELAGAGTAGPGPAIDRTTYRAVNFWTDVYLHSIGVTRQVRFVVVHNTEGSYPTDVQYLCAPNPQHPVSCHYYIRRDGAIFELVDPASAAWHTAVAPENRVPNAALRAVWGTSNENYHSLGIELEAFRDQAKTAEQVAATVALVRWLRTQYPLIGDDRLHLVGHDELSLIKVDPAPWDWDSFMPPVRGARYFPETGQSIVSGFRDFFEANGDVARFGYPLTGEEPDPHYPVTVQYFENCRFEWHPGGFVRLGAVGRLYLQAIGRLP
ncbi:MAG TPA: peptidoglycan recognition family protein [Chloroflexia bacterium]|nr:peptidoglycan recognition family protein [Chloroflexia bacterium]